MNRLLDESNEIGRRHLDEIAVVISLNEVRPLSRSTRGDGGFFEAKQTRISIIPSQKVDLVLPHQVIAIDQEEVVCRENQLAFRVGQVVEDGDNGPGQPEMETVIELIDDERLPLFDGLIDIGGDGFDLLCAGGVEEERGDG